MMLKNYYGYLTKNKHIFLIALGTIAWSLTMVKSGIVYRYGMGFWGPNGHDGIWHISLIQNLSSFSLEMPVFSGTQLSNYHFGFDLIMALVHLFTKIPVSILYFQIVPPILAAALGIALYNFMINWTKKPEVANWSLFFLYFGSSFGLSGESAFWAQQSLSTLINPPFAFSLVVIFIILTRLYKHTNSTSIKSIVITGLLVGLLSLIKIYASVLILSGLIFLSLIDRKYSKITIASIIFTALFFLPFNSKSGSLVVFQPFWFLENMVGLSDRFYWPKMYNAMIVYKTTRNWFKFIPAYGLVSLIFVVGNLGTRIISLVYLLKGKIDSIALLILSSSIVGIIIPTFFIQQGTPWNTIQFFYYSQVFIGIFAAIAITKLSKVIKLVVVIIAIFSSHLTLRNYLPNVPPAKLSINQLSALKYLSAQDKGVVFAPPVQPDQYKPAPRELYDYESTAYVSAFSKKPVYVEDTVNLNITGYDWKERIEKSELFMGETDLYAAKKFLYRNNIRYIYLPEIAKRRPRFSASELGGKVIYENSQVAIWQIN